MPTSTHNLLSNQNRPPIFVNEVENIVPLQALLGDIAPDSHERKIINSNNVKIMAKTKESYSNIIKALSEKETKFHIRFSSRKIVRSE